MARSPQKARSSQTSGSASASRTGGRKTKAQLAQEQARKNEIHLFIYLAVCTFFFISNFGWCGVVGNFFARFMFGLFGITEYILPLYVFLTSAFLLSNGAKKTVVNRVLCVGLFIVAAAFIAQLTAGADHMTAKLLYDQGAQEKKGGGFILGGLLVVLYNLIGKPGAIIVIALLIIIGIIVVLNVSLIDFAKQRSAQFKNRYNALYEDDEDEIDPEAALEAKRRTKLDNIKVEQEKPVVSVKKKKKKVKNKKVEGEEVHELKPLPHEDLFNPNLTLQDAKDVSEGYVDLSLLKKKKGGVTELRSAKADIPPVPDTPKEETVDFFERPEYTQSTAEDQAWEKDLSDELLAKTDDYDAAATEVYHPFDGVETSKTAPVISEPATDAMLPEADGEPVTEAATRKRKKTKESEQEMLSERDQIAETIQENSEQKPIKEYKFPPLKLLKSGRGKGTKSNEASVRETAMKLKSTLENFGVNVTVTDYSCGPSVTRYELQPEQGVKVSKITNLADDIKLNLAAADIRIEAPIPGKPAVGIEVPNKESQPVFFRDLLESDNFQKFPSNIAFAVGKDISGQVVVADIAKMPHLLIAGATGSGKSVCINTLIMSILYKAKPDDVKLIMVDPKQVELSIYNGIPHMLIPVVTDPKKAAGALNWAVLEMTNRYQLFAQYNVRNLQGYNEKVKAVTGTEEGNEDLKKLPQIVIIVDELADLMMVAHGEVEDAIVRLSQLARAAGIHLVIATQRPSVDVITGLIKANVPSRIAMTVSSGVDSRTILDMNGAEKLLGKGDMLFYPTGYPKPVRVQGAFLSDDEIADVVDFLKEESGEVTYDESISNEIANTKVGGSGGGTSSAEPEYDDYFVDAGKFIIGKDKASIGMLQRVYKIGFNRAARIMDQLSEAGVVGPEEGTKPRKVLMSMEEFENYVEEYL
ncbi:DNA translocase FtsK [Eubacterium sp. MSJ-21]|nr:DNA translocase FtsK [Eubacterium sp. MSJ-21]